MTPDEPFRSEHAQAFILAGGQSRRMGSDKARLPWNGQPIVERIRDAITTSVAHVWLVCKVDSGCEDLGLPILYDRAPGRALVYGLQAALEAPGPPWRFVLACDMPGVDGGVLSALWHTAHAAGAPGSYPRHALDGTVDPLPSLWHRDVALRCGAGWGLAARGWVERAGLVPWFVPAALQTRLANVNTPEDWKDWQCRARDAQ